MENNYPTIHSSTQHPPLRLLAGRETNILLGNEAGSYKMKRRKRFYEIDWSAVGILPWFRFGWIFIYLFDFFLHYHHYYYLPPLFFLNSFINYHYYNDSRNKYRHELILKKLLSSLNTPLFLIGFISD